MVDTLHSKNIAVIMDVVYNHTGEPNYYRGYDNKYFYRLNKQFGYINNSGCGNDFKTESPMARRLIIDSLKHFVTNYHVDGFRFDLAALIDKETLILIEKELKKIKKDVVLIAEPWAMGVSDIKGKLNDKTELWTYWNDDYRNQIKEFAHGKGNRDSVMNLLEGSVKLWAGKPYRSVNYVESHDDMTVTDEITDNPKHDGRNPSQSDLKRNKLLAASMFTSLGIPMIAEGQEFLRSKNGIKNSYNSGDEINSIKWSQADIYRDNFDFYKNFIKLRLSNEGMALRNCVNTPANYMKFIKSQEGNLALGYIVNSDHSGGDKSFVVLLNPEARTVNFSVNFSSGIVSNSYRLITDGESFKMSGISGESFTGMMNVLVEPLSFKVFMEK